MKLFKDKYPPSCSYCELGELIKNSNSILCSKYGEVDFTHSCSKFRYAPLKRIPSKHPILQSFSEEDFSII